MMVKDSELVMYSNAPLLQMPFGLKCG